MELRMQMFGLVIDNVDKLSKDSKLHNQITYLFKVLGEFFGHRFCFKFQSLLKEAMNHQTSTPTEPGALTLPHTMWPISNA